CVRGSEDFDYW
nr:immunoglobulin heavy chain junction region [Macaca mulatta]MOY23125.1 immunoglobulin heavy chain junction region [Macaca mulatta]MOY23684.1 immunoglobulin heavy chain junction region [Macaca mulatta]MOY23827.1 immunoglobulin heavy chain junction region [Macaca mulatta]MOY25425.1 immunoglobulin heavy chain junction region [Macaca mulatta]